MTNRSCVALETLQRSGLRGAIGTPGWPPEHVEVMKMRMHREHAECFADPTRAARGLGEIVETLERTVGSDHPISAQALGYLAVANAKVGKTALAHAQFEQAIERLGVKGAGSVQFREALQSTRNSPRNDSRPLTPLQFSADTRRSSRSALRSSWSEPQRRQSARMGALPSTSSSPESG